MLRHARKVLIELSRKGRGIRDKMGLASKRSNP
jgi:hypothetical protein